MLEIKDHRNYLKLEFNITTEMLMIEILLKCYVNS